MECIYAYEDLRSGPSPSLFLAGPSPRSSKVPSWRPKAVDLMKSYAGSLLLPEPRNGLFNPDMQVPWEWAAMDWATNILFWVPRDLVMLPGFTTNVEFGYWASKGPGKCLLAYPEGAPKMDYLHRLADRHGIPVLHDLQEALHAIIPADNHPRTA